MDDTDCGSEFSDLYCRYNGSMLGQFLVGVAAEADEIVAEFPRLQGRMAEFLEETGTPPILPTDRDVFVNHRERVTAEALVGLQLASERMAFFAHLSMTATLYVLRRRAVAVGAATDAALDEGLRAQTVERLRAIDLDESPLDRFLERTTVENDRVQFHSLNSAALSFVRELIEPVPKTDTTAFVIMPFELSERYSALYLPVLKELGLRGFRAWGGLTTEFYQELMVTLISKCETCLVELTGVNDNVLYEMGLAHGLDRTVLPIVQKDHEKLPANLRNLAIVPYDWPDGAVEQCVGGLSMLRLGAQLERVGE